jgi:aspartyl-tRNA(Asn)/glutamyl-tRNA(Gln) amidotransferase subunit C
MAVVIVRPLPGRQPFAWLFFTNRPLAGAYRGILMSLDPATVKRIARLARIRLEDEALPRLQGELNGILGWIEQLSEVNVEGVAPLTGGAQIALRLRTDEITDGGYPERVLANAPDRAGPFFAVPKVVE